MNILVTLDKGYVKPLCVMLRSLFAADPQTCFDIYVLNKSLSEKEYTFLNNKLCGNKYTFHDIKINDKMLKNAPVTDRYPHEMYYRIFAAKFLPETVDKVLYLDPDMVILKTLHSLYDIDLGDNYFAAASHVGQSLQLVNEIRLKMDGKGPYINSGVMVMNISLLRKEQNYNKVFEYINKNKRILFLPDQDVISGIYSDKIITVDPYIYNMTERMLLKPKSIINDIDFDWVKNNSAIIHYCGRNKPWKDYYFGVLDEFYRKFSVDIDA